MRSCAFASNRLFAASVLWEERSQGGPRLVIQRMETTMWYRLSIAASTMLVTGTIAATAAELPTYAVTGLPMTPVQASILGASKVQEQASAIAPKLAGMPASAVQIAVLKRRSDRKLAEQAH
jgi:hypothetical protein